VQFTSLVLFFPAGVPFPDGAPFPGRVLFLGPFVPVPEGCPRNPLAASRLVTVKAMNAVK